MPLDVLQLGEGPVAHAALLERHDGLLRRRLFQGRGGAGRHLRARVVAKTQWVDG